MPPRFAVLCQIDPPAAEAWLALRRPDAVLAFPGLLLATWGELYVSGDGRAKGVLAGALANDHELRVRLAARGVALELTDHRALALETLAQSGPAGIGHLRWQGSLACAHLGQRTVLVARDPLGIGGLHVARLAGGEVVASDPALLDGRHWPVPPGLAGVATAAGIAWQGVRLSRQVRPWLRDLPDGLREANADQVLAGLLSRIRSAAEALARGLGGLVREAPRDVAGAWLAAAISSDSHDGSGCWTMSGVDSLLGIAPSPRARWHPAPGGPRFPAWAPAEPIDGVPAADREQRILRATWLADGVLATARAESLAAGRVLVAPHLDAAVLAWHGAVPDCMRPRP